MMIASRAAKDVRPCDHVIVPVGCITHVGEVINVHEAHDLPIRLILVVNCEIHRRAESLRFMPTALVTVERAA